MFESLAATYSRGIYKTTTIGKAAFDGRVRNGNGSDHSFMTTKVLADGHRRFATSAAVFAAVTVMTLNSKDRAEAGFGRSLKATHRLSSRL